MKNASREQLAALRKRADRIFRTLPPLDRRADGALSARSRDAFENAARRILLQNRAVGASVVLCSSSGAVDTFCFGNARLHPRRPVRDTTCFRVASVSKLVMTLGALSLTEDGLLDLDADISGYLGYRVRSPHAPDVPITLRMLLTHTAAIRDEGSYGTRGMESGCTLHELLSDVQNWLGGRPGEVFHYTNLGAGAAGVVMEKAAGEPFEAIMRKRVFSKLSIRASYDPRQIVPTDDLADGYGVHGLLPPIKKYDAAVLAAKPPEPFCPETDYLICAGRLITDSAGLARLVQLLASADGMGVLSPQSLALMRAVQDGAHGVKPMARGLNTAFLPDVFSGFSPVGHQGVAYGMCAELFADPARNVGVGVMTNGVRLVRAAPLMRVGFDLLALGFAALKS